MYLPRRNTELFLSFIIDNWQKLRNFLIIFFPCVLSQVIDDTESMVCSIAEPEPESEKDEELEPVLKKWVRIIDHDCAIS